MVYQGNKLINKVILEEGWGRPDYRKNSQREKLTDAYHFAKNNHFGIFGSLCRIPSNSSDSANPSNCLIKGNIDKNTYQKFYHLPSCRHYNEVVIEQDTGEKYFCSEEEALQTGFKKASGCP